MAPDRTGPQALAELVPRPLSPFGAAGRASPTARLLEPVTRGYLWVCAALCAFTAALMAAAAWPRAEQALALAGAYGVLAAAAAGSTRLAPRHRVTALTLLLSLVTLATGAATLWLGWGLAAPGLPLAALLVCALCAVAGWRAGLPLVGVAVATIATVALFEPTPPAAAAAVLPGRYAVLATLAMAIAAGLACGALLSRMLARSMRSAAERERRFTRLLALAADAYWETDHAHRLLSAEEHGEAMQPLQPDCGLGEVPWELPHFSCDAETLDQLQADLDARLPLRDVPLRWLLSEGDERAYLVSGEPRFNERGVFTGYWGVARDVTAMQAAHEALLATETRYQELFAHIPSPLVVHRDGRIVDANPAFVALMGHADLDTLVGTDLLALYQSGDSRERARRRVEALEDAPLGTALPVADFRLDIGGRVLSVRATSVRVMTDGGPAMLAIYVDDTERLAAEEAVRRSEALLSHLVSSSPDLITLTDTATDRYAMVNPSFERMSGWTAAEAVGRTALELGIWESADESDRIAAMLRERDAVTDVATTFVARDGSRVSMVISAARFAMERREYIVINGRDVTEKERERLQREAILANASIGIAVTRDRRFVLANHHFERIFGWPAGTLVGEPGNVVWPSEADYRQVGELLVPALAKGEPIEVERPARRRDGSTFMASVRGRAVDLADPAAGGTVWIVEDVTERRQFEQALATARDEAEAANRAKSAFLANTSHELRTPLNGMVGLALLARDENLTEERRRQYLDQIVQSAQSLADIISDILDLSKIEAGKLLIETTVFDVGAEMQALQRTYAPLAAGRGLELRLDVSPDAGGSVSGDPLRLRQIASNFLGNAIKFTDRGHVELAARRPGGVGSRLLRIEVRDSGPGIDPATSARLFQPFTQADQSTTRRYGGTGLGLSICQQLATLMGGTVGVDSRLGHGSIFWAELPLAPAAAPTPAPLPSPPVRSDGLAGARVLMVEDNPVNMMIAVAMIERWGVHVTQAQDGRDALAAVQRSVAAGEPFDAVLMDVQMPVMSGHEATRALRAAGHRVPVIALTAAALVSERDEALRAGMDDFLTKPIDAGKLRAALLRWCAPAEADDRTAAADTVE